MKACLSWLSFFFSCFACRKFHHEALCGESALVLSCLVKTTMSFGNTTPKPCLPHFVFVAAQKVHSSFFLSGHNPNQ